MNTETTAAEELVTALSNGISHGRLYYSNHPKVGAYAESFVVGLGSLLQERGKDRYFIGVVEGQLVQDGRYLLGSTIVARRLIEFAELLHCGGFLFKDRLKSREVVELFGLYAELKEETQSLEEARGLLKSRGISNIELSPEYEHAGWFGQFVYDGQENWGIPSVTPDGGNMVPIYQTLFQKVEEAHSCTSSDSAFDLAGTRSISEKLVQTADGGHTDFLRNIRYPDYDSYTVGHSVRVAQIAVLVGNRLGMSPEMLMELGTTGLLHDVGKSKIPEEILFKPGRLDEEEREIVSRHADLGAQALVEQGASPLAIGAAWGHHVRHDRRGYPKLQHWGVTGRITALLQVCDVFEALTAIRPYKAAMTPRRAYETMLKDREAFDPAAFHALVMAMGLYPPGSEVLLSDGTRGLVVVAGDRIDRPRVQITHEANGEPAGESDRRIVDLGTVTTPSFKVSKLLLEGDAQWLDDKVPDLREPELADFVCTGHLATG